MKRRIIAAFAAVILLIFSFPVTSLAAFSGDDRIVIVIDPGHGGYDPGASSGGVGEKDLNLRLATLIRDRLAANGSFSVYMTRSSDTYLSLAQRGVFANSVNADLLISIHFDSDSGASWGSGVTAYTSVLDKYALISLGNSIASSVASAAGMSNNGIYRRADNQQYYWNAERQWDIQGVNTGVLSDYYGIPTWCAKFGIKSLIIEHGYMSNAGDFAKITAAGTLEKMADAESAAIVSYFTNHAHSYGASETDFPSNCVFQGKSSERCTVCGHRRNVALLPAAPDNHYWINEVTSPASCGRDGSVYHECRITKNLNDKGYPIANHTETKVIPAPQDHNYVLKETVAATHTEDGYNRYECSLCGYSFKDILKAEGHSFKFVLSSEPTCTEAGGNLYRCQVCSYEYRDGPAAKGHDFEEIIKKEPTCTEKGEKELKCKVCGETRTEELPALGHDMKTVSETAAACTEGGEKITECSRCGEKKTEVFEKLSHNYLLTAYEPATCGKSGSAQFVCKNCGSITEGTLKAATHVWQEKESTPAGFFTKGTVLQICKNCGAMETLTVKPEVLSSPAYIFAAFSFLLLAAAVALAVIFFPKLFKKKLPPVPAVAETAEDENAEDLIEADKAVETSETAIEETDGEEIREEVAEEENGVEKEKEPLAEPVEK